MTIDWTNFTPWLSLMGGILIGLAASWLILFNGKIAGISGILGGFLQRDLNKGDRSWRISFLVGIMIAPLFYSLFAPLPSIQVTDSYFTLACAGLLVGLGTRYGSGCTSGHGICGLSRLSVRSLVATLSFMATGFITVALVRHVL